MWDVTPNPDDAAILAIERPHPKLWTYYLLQCLAILPLFPILALPAWFRYSTLRYKFTAEGISMSWGILFRREIIIQYARIQDIHLRSNVVERWLGLARVLVQTASGSAGAEMTIEGLREFEEVRDFLYSRMRGATDGTAQVPAAGATRVDPAPVDPGALQELTRTLQDVAHELRAIRAAIEAGRASPEEANHA